MINGALLKSSSFFFKFAAGIAIFMVFPSFVSVAPTEEYSDVRISGKKMEILPRHKTNVFSGDVVVEHSSFTMRAERVVSRDSNRHIEAYGGVSIVSKKKIDSGLSNGGHPKTSASHESKDDFYYESISGEEVVYFAPASTGAIVGNPAVMVFSDKKNVLMRLEAPRMNFSSHMAIAEGASTTLIRQDIDAGLFVRIKAARMRYSRSPELFFADSPEDIFVDSAKNNYKSSFLADEIAYDISGGKICLKGNVSGRINRQKAKK